MQIRLPSGQIVDVAPGTMPPNGTVYGGSSAAPPAYVPPFVPPSAPTSTPSQTYTPAVTPPNSYSSAGESFSGSYSAHPVQVSGGSGTQVHSGAWPESSSSGSHKSVRSGLVPSFRWKWLFVGFAGAMVAAMYSRGYLIWGSSGLAINSLPVIQTIDGPAYRRWDMYMEFRDRNIWTKPEMVVPDSYIEAGAPIANANLVGPQGNFRIKGDLIDSRVTVPNGMLTVDGNVSGSFLTARHIVTHGKVSRTVESATIFTNTDPPGIGNRRIEIPASKPVAAFTPWPSAPRSAPR